MGNSGRNRNRSSVIPGIVDRQFTRHETKPGAPSLPIFWERAGSATPGHWTPSGLRVHCASEVNESTNFTEPPAPRLSSKMAAPQGEEYPVRKATILSVAF